MKRIIRIGKPTHLQAVPHPRARTACGLAAHKGLHVAHDPRDVDCIRCRTSKFWQRKINGDKA